MSHHNTLLHQMLSLVPRHDFQRLARAHPALRAPRTFSFWSHFVHLAFIQLASRASLRDAVRGMTANVRRLYHLGVKPAARSTFADANASRPAAFFQGLFQLMLQRCQTAAPRHGFRFKNKLLSLDATTIRLCLEAFPWATFRQQRGGIKIHTLLDHDGDLPSFVTVTPARRHEAKQARKMPLPKGSIVVFDRGYTDYAWFAELDAAGVFLVTRLKTNAAYKVVERRAVDKAKGVTSDQIITLAAAPNLRMRRIGLRDAQTGKHYFFLTNNLRLAASTIAAIYKDRWKIETFFRWIKQNLKIKRFVGTSENAVLSQVYVALIVYLLLAYLKFTSRLDLSLQQMLQLMQLNLFRRLGLDDALRPPKNDVLSSNDRMLRLPI